MGKISIDYKRATEVAKHVVGMMYTKKYPFNISNIFPDESPPKNIEEGSLEHALYIFYSCSSDSMRPAEQVYESIDRIAKKVPLYYFTWLNEKDMREVLKENLGEKEGGIGDPYKSIIENTAMLNTHYNGDPRNIRKKTIDETIKKLSKFRGVKKQVAALIMKNMVKSGFWPFSKYQIPIKIDRHVLRISLGSGVITYSDSQVRHDVLTNPLSKLYREITSQGIYTQGKRISSIELNDSFWAVGSKVCRKNNMTTCSTSCGLGCDFRPHLDKKATVYTIKEHRKEKNQLILNL